MGHEEKALLRGVDTFDDSAEFDDECRGAWKTWRSSSNKEKLVLLRQRPFFTAYVVFLHILCLVLAGTVVANVFYPAMISHEDALDRKLPHIMEKQYELRKEYASDHAVSDYSGLPNANNTHAWDELIKPTWFVASQELLEYSGESIDNSVKLAEGGYLAGLGVYHDIHCLRRLRLYLHADYYYQELTEANLKYLRGHLGHCIEALRKSVMCNVDTSIYTFTWENATDRRPQPKSNQQRKCLNWESLQDWLSSQGREVPLNPMLLRPTGVADKILMRGLEAPAGEEVPQVKGRRDPSWDAIWQD